MTQIEQLLAKAISTDSEEEAIACLRMARKQGKSFTAASSYKGKTAEQWYESFTTLSAAYIRKKISFSALAAARTEQDVQINSLKSKITMLYIIIPIIATVVATITYLLVPKIMSCWLF